MKLRENYPIHYKSFADRFDSLRGEYAKNVSKSWNYTYEERQDPTLMIEVEQSHLMLDKIPRFAPSPSFAMKSKNSNNDEFLVFVHSKPHGVGKTNSGAYISDRYSQEAAHMMGFKRSKKNLAFYTEVYEVNEEEITRDIKVSIEEEFDGKYSDIAKKLFDERVDNNLADIFDMLDNEQSKIIESSKKDSSIWIQGLAGTGKTVLANELVSKFIEGKTSICLYPNTDVMNKSTDFFKLMSATPYMNTYEEFEKFLMTKIIDKLNMRLKTNIPNSVMEDISINGTEAKVIKGKIVSLFYKHMDEVDFMRLLVDNNVKVEELYDSGWVATLMNHLSNNIDFYNSLMDEDSYISDFKMLKEYPLHLSKPNILMTDESPLILEFPLLKLVLKGWIHIDQYITSFDMNQYSSSQVDEILKYIHFDEKKSLVNVYRTTHEIFTKASYFVKEQPWEAPVSIEDSFTITEHPLFDEKFKMSDFIYDPSLFIGREFKKLSIDVDVLPNKENQHMFFAAFTRAIQELNAFGKYATEVNDG